MSDFVPEGHLNIPAAVQLVLKATDGIKSYILRETEFGSAKAFGPYEWSDVPRSRGGGKRAAVIFDDGTTVHLRWIFEEKHSRLEEAYTVGRCRWVRPEHLARERLYQMLCVGKVTAYERGAESLEEIPVGVWQGSFGNSYLESGTVAYKPKFPATDPIRLPIIIEKKSLHKALSTPLDRVPVERRGDKAKVVEVRELIKRRMRAMRKNDGLGDTLTKQYRIDIEVWFVELTGTDAPGRSTLEGYLKEILAE